VEVCSQWQNGGRVISYYVCYLFSEWMFCIDVRLGASQYIEQENNVELLFYNHRLIQIFLISSGDNLSDLWLNKSGYKDNNYRIFVS